MMLRHIIALGLAIAASTPSTAFFIDATTQTDRTVPLTPNDCLLSVEADTSLPPACTFPHAPHQTHRIFLSPPKRFEPAQPSYTRLVIQALHMHYLLYLVDGITNFFYPRSPAMANEYYTAYRLLANAMDDLNATGLLNTEKTPCGIRTFCIARLGLNATAHLFSSFINHVNQTLQLLQEQEPILAHMYQQATEQSYPTEIINNITTLQGCYTYLTTTLEEFIKITVNMPLFETEQKALLAAEIAHHHRR